MEPKRSDATVTTSLGAIHCLKAGEGPSLLALHGMAASAWSWSRCLPLLARSFTVYVPDLPGHGQSEAKREAVSVEHHAAAMSALLDALDVDRCYLAGAALGSLVALELGVRRPQTVAGLLLLGTPNFPDRQARNDWLGSRAATFVDENGHGVPMQEEAVRARYKARTPTLVQELNAERARAGLWALHDVWAIAAYDAEAAAAALSQPAIFCAGEHDPFASGSAGLRTAAPQARHLALAGVGHYPAWDAPERTAELALELVQRVKSEG
ncbi:MAG: alpha/beta hydrolase [Chloroflexota bacterium]|nr:alpha/beta hydrolase [Chloroflexota bacterium]